jgi:hypothetical protein
MPALAHAPDSKHGSEAQHNSGHVAKTPHNDKYSAPINVTAVSSSIETENLATVIFTPTESENLIGYVVRAYKKGVLQESITGIGVKSPIIVRGFPAPPAMADYTFTVSSVHYGGEQSAESEPSAPVHIMFGHMPQHGQQGGHQQQHEQQSDHPQLEKQGNKH